MFTEKFFALSQYGHEATLWLLILLSVLSLAFILERFFILKKVRATSQKTSQGLREVLQSNSLNEIEQLSQDRSSIEGRALNYGMRHLKANGSEGLAEIFDSFTQMEKPHLDKHLNFLATVGSNAPFIGLLGTVFGIMDAFRGLASGTGDPTAVMSGISEALVATAVGLLVAIPAVVAYNYFQRQVKGILQGLESAKDICIAFSKSAKKGSV